MGALYHFRPSAARSTVLRQRLSPVEQLHGDSECRSVSLHLLAAVAVLDSYTTSREAALFLVGFP